MSGGSYNYIYCKLSEECENRMYDAEMDDMIKDLCEVLHDLEWWKSCDSSEEKYRATLAKFKAKWFKGNRQERLKGYIDDQIGIVRKQLYALIGEPTGAESEDKEMTRGEIIDGLELYTVGGLKKSQVHITVEELQKYIDEIKALKLEPFINKPCISSGVCKHDKNEVLDKIRTEIKALTDGAEPEHIWNDDALAIIDKYKAESEE